MANWLSFKDESGWIHILPDTDIKPHSIEKEGLTRKLATINCPCKPKVDYLGQRIIHNSFEDQKRIEESVSKIIGNN